MDENLSGILDYFEGNDGVGRQRRIAGVEPHYLLVAIVINNKNTRALSAKPFASGGVLGDGCYYL